MSKLICYGGSGTATGANFLLEIGNKRVLIDCGMLQGSREASQENAKDFEYDSASIDILFVTHAHIDHIGLIPKLYKGGFRGVIYSTPETKSIAKLLLADAAKINREKEHPLFTMNDVEGAISLWQTISYHDKKSFDIGESGKFEVELYDAGHVLGSSMVRITTPKGSMLFTGDIGNSP
ncbi:MBL fold metallo-hydrolase, partial [Candidatus Parcubacteria bacterium]|nr:MBL fold metallo-hydrolase [Candidatus Parcubacteria bacterium]